MDYNKEVEDKPLEWFNDFDKAVEEQLLLLQASRETKKLFRLAKTWFMINKVRERLYGEREYSSTKQKIKFHSIKAIVKTSSVLSKTYAIDDVMNYKVLIK